MRMSGVGVRKNERGRESKKVEMEVKGHAEVDGKA